MFLSLNGNWKCREAGTEQWLDAAVPGCNYLDLMQNGILPDPFLGTNEKDAYWVSEKDWEYTREFELSEQARKADKVLLVCEQLDTLCDISLNGKQIGSAQNTHLLYEFDSKPYVKVGKNSIEIRFFSPVNYVKREQKKHRCPVNNNGLTGIPLIRKPQCHFGWDWGPVLTPSGISGNIGLVTYHKARISDMKVLQTHHDNKVTLDIEADIEIFNKNDIKFALMLECPNGEKKRAEGACSNGKAQASFLIDNPELWWTNDLSGKKEQPLYTLKLSILDEQTVLDQTEKEIGLRTLELNRNKDEFGENCQFVLNGKPLFIKGANWIPSDSFITRVDTKKLTYYINAALFANFNMLRVWGGGYYGSDTLYKLCDKYGILIWQDFQFACQAYPFFWDEFRYNVEKEIQYQVSRLRHHACLAVWCGNNEIEQMTPLWLHRRKFVKWTERFFYDILPRLVRESDGNTPYITGSPYGSGFLKDVGSDKIGDTHLWEVWHGLQPMTYYRKRFTRFCSEFGFESLPDLKTIEKFAGKGPHTLESEVFNAHQKCNSGNLKMVYYISTRFRLPRNFEDYIYLSQIAQQECVKDATEHWRRNRGRCNGAMYWQFNDCWPVCSWASVDYYGNYKALQYTARHFNAPLTLSIENQKDGAKIWLLNDTLQSNHCTVSYQLMRFDGAIITENSVDAVAESLSSQCVIELNKDTINDYSDIQNMVLVAYLTVDKMRICRKTALFAQERDIDLPQVKITKKVYINDGKAVIQLTSDRFARLVCLHSDCNTLPFSDNFFDILPGETVTVTQDLDKDYTGEELCNRYTVKTVSAIPTDETPKDIKKLRRKVFSKPLNFIMMLIYKLGIK